MATIKLKRKERLFDEDAENRKDYIAYNNIHCYAKDDIPLAPAERRISKIISPSEIWKDFDPTGEALEFTEDIADEVKQKFSFCAKRFDDGNLYVDMTLYPAKTESTKCVLLVGERDKVPQQEIIDGIIGTGASVFTLDYNGIFPNTRTTFPASVSYGKYGNEGDRLNKVAPTAKESCAYLYVLILRRAIACIKKEFKKKIIIVGIRDGCELAMAAGGSERENVMAIGCIGGAGYPEYCNISRYTDKANLSDEKLAYIVGMSGVSYMVNYPHPVFTAIGSNGSFSDVDRLSSLKKLISGPLTVCIASQKNESIEKRDFDLFLTWLTGAFWGSTFPEPPVTAVDVNRDGTVYAEIQADVTFPIKSATLYYSYGNPNHKTRIWEKVPCETVGNGQYLAKMHFSKPCSALFFYTEATYINGITATETPKYLDMSSYRLLITEGKNNAMIYVFDSIGEFSPIEEDAVVFESDMKVNSAPNGVKGEVCENGKMRIFVGDGCRGVQPDKILQIDCFSSGDYYKLEIAAETDSGVFTAVKHIPYEPNFDSVQFDCCEFKDDKFRPLTSWENVTALTVGPKKITVNKILFI